MKNLKKLAITSCIVALGLTSCEDITDLNINPSFPTEVAPANLIAPMEQQMARAIQFDSRYIGSYIQYHSNTTRGNVWDQYGYARNSDAGGEMWRAAYFGIGLNLVNMQTSAVEQKRFDMVGMAKIIGAWSWQSTTDLSGDILDFSQLYQKRLTFDYVGQEVAYKEVVRLLNEAIADLDRTDGLPSQTLLAGKEVIYNGDKAKWKKFAYGILARNLNNQINKSTYNPDRVIQYCNLSLASAADDAVIKFNGTITDDSNFYGPLRNNWSGFRQTDYIVRAMDGGVTSIFPGAKDPRIGRVLAPSKGASETAPATAANPDPTKYVFVGNPINTTAATSGTSQIPNLWGEFTAGTSTMPGRYLFRNNVDFPIMTYAEIQFIKAEAAFIKGDKVMALDAYKKGIDASIDLVNKYTVARTTFPITTAISAAEKSAFLANTTVVPVAANLTLSQIMIQKYVALYGFGFIETWNDLRKYNYDPAIYTTFNTLPPLDGYFIDNNGKVAQRLRPRYNSEYVWNFASLVKIGGDKSDYHTVPMWFTQK
jgi:hypothetical protein